MRSCFGSQSALFSENLIDDMRRVGTAAVDAFVFAAEIPKTSVGKFLKTRLREEYSLWKWDDKE